jgi:hypothetical protein
MNQHIKQAIDNFRRSAVRYAKTERYYRGDHDLAFATEKFENAFGQLFREFAMNLCPAICDAVKDKLRIEGFGVNGKSDAFTRSPADPLDSSGPEQDIHEKSFTPKGVTHTVRTIDHIWFRNRMPQRAGEIHKEALKNGDAYAIVWFDASGEVTIYPHRAANVTVHYGEDSPGQIQWAAKYWRTSDRRTRLNIFYPDRIERYVTKKEFDAAIPDPADFVPIAGNAGVPPASSAEHENAVKPQAALHAGHVRSGHIVANPFGVVPVFHFANNADLAVLVNRSSRPQFRFRTD